MNFLNSLNIFASPTLWPPTYEFNFCIRESKFVMVVAGLD